MAIMQGILRLQASAAGPSAGRDTPLSRSPAAMCSASRSRSSPSWNLGTTRDR